MVLIDTNVAVSLWIDNDWTDNARCLLVHDPEWRTEPYALIELSNVFATYVRHKLLAREDAVTRLEEAEALFAAGLFRVAHRQALDIAIHYRISAYDARFLAAARSLGAKLVTEDAKLRQAAPTLTQSLAEALAGADSV